ncbi:MAG: hypothetical protein A2Z18_09215 [Armatimonadetes bacterium RBG_16_58_9]|nr:MAG: hypothetical protein A2Z18_09215 [Armatimonadetes bacterium RBG_16_58_9]
MIIDDIRNASQYYGLGESIAAGLKFLQTQDFSNMQPGRYDVPDSDCYAIVIHYDTKPVEQGIWEAHRKYIDIQYVHAGAERIGWANINSLRPTADYDPDKDFLAMEGEGDFATLRGGTFMLLMPQDPHMPSISVGPGQAVIKVIVKVPV